MSIKKYSNTKNYFNEIILLYINFFGFLCKNFKCKNLPTICGNVFPINLLYQLFKNNIDYNLRDWFSGNFYNSCSRFPGKMSQENRNLISILF